MCDVAVRDDPCALEFVRDWFVTQGMCDAAARGDPSSLLYVSGWFVTQQQVKLWYDDDYHRDDGVIIKWYEGYQKRKAQKAKVKEELLPIT